MFDLNSISTWIIIITCLFSIPVFSNHNLRNKSVFNAFMIKNRKEYYRFISSGFIHANWIHLGLNMIVLFYFGYAVESFYNQIMQDSSIAKASFVLLYLGGLVASSIPDYLKHKDNRYFNSLGASGATSAVLFSFILFQPWSMLYIFGIIPVPAIIFGALYILYSSKMSKESSDNINHAAHLYGALFGLVFTIVMKPQVIIIFINQLLAF